MKLSMVIKKSFINRIYVSPFISYRKLALIGPVGTRKNLLILAGLSKVLRQSICSGLNRTIKSLISSLAPGQ